jgi:hypothetical protein
MKKSKRACFFEDEKKVVGSGVPKGAGPLEIRKMKIFAQNFFLKNPKISIF